MAFTHHNDTYVEPTSVELTVSEGKKALSRKDAMPLIVELQDVERCMRDLRRALRTVLDDPAS